MKTLVRSLALCAGLLTGVVGAHTVAAEDLPDDLTHIIENVTAIDAVNGVRSGVSVLIQGNVIHSIVDSGVPLSVSSQVNRTDGTGRFLIPGLVDSHVHLGFYSTVGPDTFFKLALGHGVTSLMDTGSLLDIILPAAEEARTNPATPDLYYSGPLLDGTPKVYAGDSVFYPDIGLGVSSPEEAAEAVDRLADAGVHYIKAYEMLTPETFKAVMERAKNHKLPVMAHPPLSMSPQDVMGLGISNVQHFRNLEQACVADETGVQSVIDDAKMTAQAEGLPVSGIRSAIHKKVRTHVYANIDLALCDSFMDGVSRKNVYQTPTLLITEGRYYGPFKDEAWLGKYDYYPFLLKHVGQLFADQMAKIERPVYEDQRWEWTKAMIGYARDKKIPILAGTDAPVGLLVPGASLHEELKLMVHYGLTPMDALKAATIEPARFLSLETKKGSIDPGKEADLVLLTNNPLEDIAHVASIEQVFNNGVRFSNDDLEVMMSEVSQTGVTGFVKDIGWLTQLW